MGADSTQNSKNGIRHRLTEKQFSLDFHKKSKYAAVEGRYAQVSAAF